MKHLYLLFFFITSIAIGQEIGVTGKTFGDSITYSDPPNFRITSKEKINGKPKFDAFLLVMAKLNGVYDISGGMQEQETFNIGKIDVWGNNNDPRLWMDLHQTQVRTRVSRETKDGTFTGYMEGDFWGGNNHYRLRHLWFDYKFLHIGQDWSFFGDKDIWPNVMDWDGPPSGIWIRQPMIKLRFKLKNNWSVETGFEVSDAEITYDPNLDPELTKAYQNTPDFINTIKKSGDKGHIRLATIIRELKYKDQGSLASKFGYGAALSGLVKTRTSAKDLFQFQVVYGKGIARYLVSFGGLNYDAVPDGYGDLKTVPAIGGWASYEYWINKKWHANLVAGFSDFESHELRTLTINGPQPPYTGTDTSIELEHTYVLFNLMYDPIPNLSFGVEYNWGKKKDAYNGVISDGTEVVNALQQSRNANRVSFGAFFNF